MRVVRPDDFDVSVADVANSAPVRVLSADELVSAFEQDGAAAERRFAGLPLVVSGVVASLHRGRAGGLVVNLRGSVFGVVACSLEQVTCGELAGLQRGTEVTVEGTFLGGRGLTVRVEGCRAFARVRANGEARNGRIA